MPPTAPYLLNLYREFPFQEGRIADLLRQAGSIEAIPADRWPRSFRVHLACMTTLVATALLPKGCNRLGFAYNANASRSGKTLLLQSAICPVYGWTCGRTWPVSGSQNKSDESELRKALDAVAMEGNPYVFFDNVRMQVESQALEAFMTMPVWTGRVMGQNTKTFSAPINATILLTGNNLRMSVDMVERFLTCDLFVEEAEAQTRPIENVMEQPWIMQNRQQIFDSVMGLVQHWDAMGRPPPPNRVCRGFETFGNTIGGIVAAAGFGDLFERRPDSESTGNSVDNDIRRLATHLMLEDFTGKLLDPIPRMEFTFDELVQKSFQDGIFHYYMDGAKESHDNINDITRIHLSAKGNAQFGTQLKHYAPEKKGRTWELPHNSRVHLQSAGSGRSRRYVATLHLTGRGRLHLLLQHHGIGLVSLDQWLESQGMPILAACTDEDCKSIVSVWASLQRDLQV